MATIQLVAVRSAAVLFSIGTSPFSIYGSDLPIVCNQLLIFLTALVKKLGIWYELQFSTFKM